MMGFHHLAWLNTLLDNLSRFLLPLIQPLQGKTSSFVKNSRHFVELLGSIEVTQENKLISFDVESLYTNVPVEEVLQIIQRKLSEDGNLKERTNLPIEVIMELLGCCVRNCYFQLKDEFFTQDEGLPMGSPLSPVIANIYMEWFETLAIQEAHKKPRVWLRYVDVTFIIWNHGNTELDAFLKHINSVRPSITFTMEKEIHNELPFLDVLVKRTDTKWETSVYRKPTHTGQYLNHESNHHQSTKRGIIKTLLDRAFGLCNTKEGLEKELDIIKNDLQRNEYSKAMVEKTLAKRQQEPHKEKNRHNQCLHFPTSEDYRRG
ncbi:uncharacterized protein [Leptinotarsa decemlineata]|uniref:uncharacterized protein n=1 Tax=Leptinotarsa decemlineata TaxID=7539 RepID=UPI003D3066C7